jgi:hypothetical protein
VASVDENVKQQFAAAGKDILLTVGNRVCPDVPFRKRWQMDCRSPTTTNGLIVLAQDTSFQRVCHKEAGKAAAS